MSKKYCIYIHIFPNKKVYIGQTCQNPIRRWREGKGYIRNNIMINAIKKYGWNNIKHEILLENLSLEEANYYEEKYIKEYKSSNIKYGYNISLGGLNRELSDKTKNKISLKIKGKNHYMYGKHLSEEIKEKISKAQKGRKLSKERVKQISMSLLGNKNSLGRKLSKEHIEAIKKANIGRKESVETREKKRQAMRKPENIIKARQRIIEYNKSSKNSELTRERNIKRGIENKKQKIINNYDFFNKLIEMVDSKKYTIKDYLKIENQPFSYHVLYNIIKDINIYIEIFNQIKGNINGKCSEE